MPFNFHRPVRTVLSAALYFLLLAGAASPVAAHGASFGDLPVVAEPVRLKHLSPAEVVALFGRELYPAAGSAVPRAARADSRGSLLPSGIEAVMRARDSRSVVLVGAESRFRELQECLEMLDVPTEQRASGKRRVVLTLRRGEPRSLRNGVSSLPGAGTADVDGRQLTLEGSPDWLHRALRQVIRAELNQPSPMEQVAP